jgi:hypothetical protein
MARKKEITLNKHEALFAKCPYPVQSKFEHDTFTAQAGIGYARYAISVINKIRKLQSDLKITTADFESECIRAEIAQLYSWLDAQDATVLDSAIENWEHVEKDYWINLLGKQAAIELLTIGRTSIETMNKMVRLPEDGYVKATQICVRLANTIKTTTQSAEEKVGITHQDEQPQAEAETKAATKKLNLKKFK